MKLGKVSKIIFLFLFTLFRGEKSKPYKIIIITVIKTRLLTR